MGEKRQKDKWFHFHAVTCTCRAGHLAGIPVVVRANVQSQKLGLISLKQKACQGGHLSK